MTEQKAEQLFKATRSLLVERGYSVRDSAPRLCVVLGRGTIAFLGAVSDGGSRAAFFRVLCTLDRIYSPASAGAPFPEAAHPQDVSTLTAVEIAGKIADHLNSTTPVQRIREIVASLSLPKDVTSYTIHLVDSEQVPSALIVFMVKGDPSQSALKRLVQFAEQLRTRIMREGDLPWPHIRFNKVEA